MNNTDEMSFIDRLKEGNIHSNKASIEVHRNMIVDNLEYIEKNNENILTPLTKEYLNKLKNIEEKEIGLNIIEPMIGISLALYFLFDSPIEKTKGIVESHKKEFKDVLRSTLDIAKHLKDQRVKDNTIKASAAFAENFN